MLCVQAISGRRLRRLSGGNRGPREPHQRCFLAVCHLPVRSLSAWGCGGG